MQLIEDSKITVIEKYNGTQYLFIQGQFHSERAETEQEPQFQNRTLHDENNQLSLQIALHHPTQQILKSMRQALRENNFKGVEIFGSSMIIVRMTKFDRIKKIFCCQDPPKYLVKFNTLQYAAKRLLILKSLYFNPNNEQMKTILRILEAAIPPPPQVQQQQYRQDMYSLDATSSYMFDKILLNEKYSIGKKMHMLLKLTYLHSQEYSSMSEDVSSISSNERKFLNSKLNNTGTRQSQSQLFQDDDNNNPPPPITIIQKMSSQKLQWIHQGLDEIGDDMLSTFNCSRKQLVEILGFCRKTVEEYYYFTLTQKQANNCQVNYNSMEGNVQNLSLSMKSLKNCKDMESNLPITRRQLSKLIFCNSSQQIFKRLFYICTLFKYETQMLNLAKEQIVNQIDQIKEKYSKTLESKLKIMQISQFRGQFMQYAQDFIM